MVSLIRDLLFYDNKTEVFFTHDFDLHLFQQRVTRIYNIKRYFNICGLRHVHIQGCLKDGGRIAPRLWKTRNNADPQFI